MKKVFLLIVFIFSFLSFFSFSEGEGISIETEPEGCYIKVYKWVPFEDNKGDILIEGDSPLRIPEEKIKEIKGIVIEVSKEGYKTERRNFFVPYQTSYRLKLEKLEGIEREEIQTQKELPPTPSYIIIKGIKYVQDSLMLHHTQAWKVFRGVLAEDQQIDGIKLKKGTIVYFDINGNLYEYGYAIEEPTIIDGIKFEGHSGVRFFKNGKIASGTLAEDQQIDGIKLKKGTIVYFDINGNLYEYGYAIEEPTIIDGIKFEEKSYVYFYKNGKIKIGWILAEDQEIQGIKLKKGTFVDFYENGKIKSGILAEDQEINGIKFKKDLRVYFHENGKIKEGTLAEDKEIDGIKFFKGDVKFHENGKIKEGTLAEDKEIDGIKFKKGDPVFFEKDGSLCSYYKKQPDGFRDMKWGTDIANLGELKYVRTDFSWGVMVVVYTKINENLDVEGVKADKIEYYFWKNKLIGVGIYIKTFDDFKIIRDYCIKKFGQPMDYCFFDWFGKITMILLDPKEGPAGTLKLFWTEYIVKAQQEGPEGPATSFSHLNSIWTSLVKYFFDYGRFPKKLSELYPDYVRDLKTFECPATGNKITKKEEIDEKTGYEYFGAKLTPDSPPTEIIACDKKGNYKEGRAVLFMDGKVEWLSEEDFQKLIKKKE